MLEKKKLLINCDVCDTRKMKEEDYVHYEQILVNSDIVIVNENSKGIFNRLPMVLNNDKMVEVSNEAELKFKNIDSNYAIKPDTLVEENTFLVVNGPLEICAGTEEVLNKYLEIIANGPVKCPESVTGYLGKVTVNGPITIYPDDCVVLKKSFEIDKYFPIRAKEGKRYYAEKEVLIKDKTVDVQKLVQKNVSFVTKRLLVPECKIEDAIPMFDELVEFDVVPEEMEIVVGNTKLSEELLLKYGTKLYVYGDLEMENCNTEICARIEKLIVKGKVSLKAEQLEVFKAIDAEYDEIEIVKGRKVKNQVHVKIDQKLLNQSPDGVAVVNVANVKISEDVSVEDILEKLQIKNCANVVCSEEQKSAVSAVAKNIANIKTENGESKEDGISLGGILKGMFDTKLVNADTFMM